jgi:hypothetical protein
VALWMPMAGAPRETGFRPPVAAILVLVLFPSSTPGECRHRYLSRSGMVARGHAIFTMAAKLCGHRELRGAVTRQ